MKSSELVRSELLSALAQLSQARPDWQLGQTFANLATTAGRLEAGGVWDWEDDEALAAAKSLLEQAAPVSRLLPEVNGRRFSPHGSLSHLKTPCVMDW